MVLILIAFLTYQALRFFRKMKQLSVSGSATDVHITKYDNTIYSGENEEFNEEMNSKLIDETGTTHYEKDRISNRRESAEKRKHPRKDFETFVEFIKEGALFKETSKDFSYSGMFIKSKTPFLTTDVGNAAEIVEWSKAGMILPTFKDSEGYSKANIDGSVKMLEEIHRDSQRRKEMQENGFKEWQKRFTWKKIAMEYENMYQRLVREG